MGDTSHTRHVMDWKLADVKSRALGFYEHFSINKRARGLDFYCIKTLPFVDFHGAIYVTIPDSKKREQEHIISGRLYFSSPGNCFSYCIPRDNIIGFKQMEKRLEFIDIILHVSIGIHYVFILRRFKTIV